LGRAERLDRLGIGAGYGRIDPHEIRGVVDELDDLATDIAWTLAFAADDDDGPGLDAKIEQEAEAFARAGAVAATTEA
jgi:hypothetical protein